MTRSKKILISCFIFLNLMVMIRIHLPMNKSFFQTLYKPLDPFLNFLSLYQSWTMFSPNPSRTNSYVTAEVLFDDGSKDTYSLPRNTDLSFADKYIFGERFRVISEAIRRDDGQFMWKDTAKFAMRQLREKNFNKIPLKVDLIRHWYITPDINQRFIPHLTRSKNYESYKFFTHEVLQ
jgi:hypothetical protein